MSSWCVLCAGILFTVPHAVPTVAKGSTQGSAKLFAACFGGNEHLDARDNGVGEQGYYDNCIFHRVVKGFMAQTGDPTGTGEGRTSALTRCIQTPSCQVEPAFMTNPSKTSFTVD
mgnify:CR=1 FL=1